MAWAPVAASFLSSANASGARSTAAPITSGTGDTGVSFGSFGGVTIGGGKSESTALYVALAALAAITLLVLVVKR